MPVSMCWAGSGFSFPFVSRLNCMKTRFQISMTLGSSLLTMSAASRLPMRSKWISEHGPHGPVSPISQKLSVLSPGIICASGRYFFHSSFASRSAARPSSSSPSKYVAYRRSTGSFHTSVSSVKAHSMASALK